MRMYYLEKEKREIPLVTMPKRFLGLIPAQSRAVFLLGMLMLVLAVFLQSFSSLPWRYSWERMLMLFANALADRYFMVMALLVLFAALGFPRRNFAGSFLAKEAKRPQARAVPIILLTIGVSVALAFLPTLYSPWDYAAAPLVVCLIALVLRGGRLSEVALGLLSAIIVLALVSYVFTILKSQLFLGGTILDEWIIAGEKVLFERPLYALIADWSMLHPQAVRLSDWVYYLFFHHMMLVALFLFACRNSAAQWRYITSLALCYLLGGLSYYAFPALGPAFFDPASFTYLAENAKFTVFIQGLLWQSTDSAVEGRLQVVETYLFIACMPSLHMAHETIMLYFSRRSPLMLLFSTAFWLASCAAVLVLGWHYFFDVIGGVLLAALVLVLVHRHHRGSPGGLGVGSGIDG